MSTESADPTKPAFPTESPGHASLVPDSPKNAPVPAADSAPPAVAESKGKPKGSGKDALDKVKVTRTSGAWTAVVVGALLLVVLLIFIAENTEPTRVHLLLWWLELPLGVLLLFSLIIGVLATALIGGARIFQVWRAARKSHKA